MLNSNLNIDIGIQFPYTKKQRKTHSLFHVKKNNLQAETDSKASIIQKDLCFNAVMILLQSELANVVLLEAVSSSATFSASLHDLGGSSSTAITKSNINPQIIVKMKKRLGTYNC